MGNNGIYAFFASFRVLGQRPAPLEGYLRVRSIIILESFAVFGALIAENGLVKKLESSLVLRMVGLGVLSEEVSLVKKEVVVLIAAKNLIIKTAKVVFHCSLAEKPGVIVLIGVFVCVDHHFLLVLVVLSGSIVLSLFLAL